MPLQPRNTELKTATHCGLRMEQTDTTTRKIIGHSPKMLYVEE